jgi:hypothetical protein
MTASSDTSNGSTSPVTVVSPPPRRTRIARQVRIGSGGKCEVRRFNRMLNHIIKCSTLGLFVKYA